MQYEHQTEAARRTTWRKQLALAMAKVGETLADITDTTLTDEQWDLEFARSDIYVEPPPFTVWTASSVYFPITYDGDYWVGRAARHPDGVPTLPQGGG